MSSTLTSDQVNYLIWRYLQECGYKYSIYAFQHETKAESFHEQFGSRIRPGSLISLIQRGLLYRELELQINKDGTRKEIEEVEPLFPPIPPKPKVIHATTAANGHMEVDDDDDEKASTVTAVQHRAASVASSRKHARGDDLLNGISSGGEKVPEKKRRRKTANSTTVAASIAADKAERAKVDGEKGTTAQASKPPPQVEEVRPITNGCSIGVQSETAIEISAADTIILGNNDPKLNSLAWSPRERAKLASGPQGSCARIWSIPGDSNADAPPLNVPLDHPTSLVKTQEVTAVQWSPDGTILATGTFDGTTRLWTSLGSPWSVLLAKCSPIISFKWNKSTTVLLSLHLDGGLLAWDIKTGDLFQNFEGKICASDMVWINDETFAASGAKGETVIFSAKTGKEGARFSGDESVGISCLAWDEAGGCLASGDKKGKFSIWKETNNAPAQSIQAHDTGIEQLIWQPTHSAISAPLAPVEGMDENRNHLLASTAQDIEIKIWSIDITSTTATPTLVHSLPVPGLAIPQFAFSPDGRYLASGSCDSVYVWRVDDAFRAYVYHASKQEDDNLLNGVVNGVRKIKDVPKPTSGDNDVEMGGMGDNNTATGIDSGKNGNMSFDISDISWNNEGKMIAVAMAGVGCVILPIRPTNHYPLTHSPHPHPAAVSDTGSVATTADTSMSIVTTDTTITEPPQGGISSKAPDGNGSNGKGAVR